jgi:hypothetical protein
MSVSPFLSHGRHHRVIDWRRILDTTDEVIETRLVRKQEYGSYRSRRLKSFTIAVHLLDIRPDAIAYSKCGSRK